MANPITVKGSSIPAPQGSYQILLSGSYDRQTTMADLQAFGLDDSSIKDAVKIILGRRPHDLHYNDPTPWGDEYRKFGYQPLSLNLVPLSVGEIVPNFENDIVLGKDSHYNNKTTVQSATLKASVTKTNSVTTSWSQTSTIEVSQSVNYEFELLGGDTSFTFSQAWQKGGSESKQVVLGLEVDTTVEVQPHTTELLMVLGQAGNAKVPVTYQATLSGCVMSNYPKKHENHHFYFTDIDAIIDALDKTNGIQMVQDIAIQAYVYLSTQSETIV